MTQWDLLFKLFYQVLWVNKHFLNLNLNLDYPRIYTSRCLNVLSNWPITSLAEVQTWLPIKEGGFHWNHWKEEIYEQY